MSTDINKKNYRDTIAIRMEKELKFYQDVDDKVRKKWINEAKNMTNARTLNIEMIALTYVYIQKYASLLFNARNQQQIINYLIQNPINENNVNIIIQSVIPKKEDSNIKLWNTDEKIRLKISTEIAMYIYNIISENYISI